MGDQGRQVSQSVPARRRRRPVLLAFAIIVGAFLLIGGATAVFLYDRATAIDRSTPAVVADAYLHAVFVERDPARVGLFTCSGWPGDDALRETSARPDREARVAWDSITVTNQGTGRAAVTVRMRFSYPGDVAPSGEQRWVLNLEEQSGWRVCGVETSA